METKVDEIAERIYRFSTFAPEIAAPAGFTFNQFLIDADEPLLFIAAHVRCFRWYRRRSARSCRLSGCAGFPSATSKPMRCGAINLWLAAAPRAQVVHGQTACMVSLNDLADRPPRALADGETMDIGGRRARYIDTPHVPHAWESGVIYEETTRTLFAAIFSRRSARGRRSPGRACSKPQLRRRTHFKPPR